MLAGSLFQQGVEDVAPYGKMNDPKNRFKIVKKL